MRRRNIRLVLRRKLDDWIAHVDDQGVKEAIAKDAFVSGGAIASMLMSDKVNDYDVYFYTKDAALLVARYYVNRFKDNPPSRFADDPSQLVGIEAKEYGDRIKIVVQSQGIAGESGTEEYRYFEQVDPDEGSAEQFVQDVTQDARQVVEDEAKGKPKYRPRFLTSNAITLSHRIQVVIRFWGTPEDVHKNYDFVHCMCAWEPGGSLTIPQEAVESMLAKHLIYRGSLYPLCSLIRTRKFLSRGWTIDAGQYVKMAWDLNGLDLTDYSVLEDQMVGVDAAHFYEVLRLLREKDGNKVDGAYLMQVIDKVFG